MPEDVSAVFAFLRALPFGEEAWWSNVLGPALATAGAAMRLRRQAREIAAMVNDLSRPLAQRRQICATYGLPVPQFAVNGGRVAVDVGALAKQLAEIRGGGVHTSVESLPLVRRMGDGFGLLRGLLAPVMWRNTKDNLTERGELKLPSCTERESFLSSRALLSRRALLRQRAPFPQLPDPLN